jgi:hypothetical protein
MKRVGTGALIGVVLRNVSQLDSDVLSGIVKVHYHLQKGQIYYSQLPQFLYTYSIIKLLCSCTCNYHRYLLLVCCKRWLPQPQLHRVVGFFSFKLLTLLFSDFVEHMCHKVLVNWCLVAPATVFPGSNACFSGLEIFLNAENLRAAFIIAFIFSQSNSCYET